MTPRGSKVHMALDVVLILTLIITTSVSYYGRERHMERIQCVMTQYLEGQSIIEGIDQWKRMIRSGELPIDTPSPYSAADIRAARVDMDECGVRHE